MRHQKAFRKLNRSPAHRHALLRGLASALILHGQIETTLPKAKELKRVADKLVTLGKQNTLHARRQAMSFLFPVNRHSSGDAKKLTAVHRLFTEISPKYIGRNGGYTRVLRTRTRIGDSAQLAVISFVEEGVQKKQEPQKKRRLVKSQTQPARQ